jgi:hypothetical protein
LTNRWPPQQQVVSIKRGSLAILRREINEITWWIIEYNFER